MSSSITRSAIHRGIILRGVRSSGDAAGGDDDLRSANEKGVSATVVALAENASRVVADDVSPPDAKNESLLLLVWSRPLPRPLVLVLLLMTCLLSFGAKLLGMCMVMPLNVNDGGDAAINDDDSWNGLAVFVILLLFVVAAAVCNALDGSVQPANGAVAAMIAGG